MNRLLLIANYDYINTALSLSGIEDEVKTIKDKFELMQYKIEIILNIKYEEIRSKVECFLKRYLKRILLLFITQGMVVIMMDEILLYVLIPPQV